MADIVRLLRAVRVGGLEEEWANEAADEIERLRGPVAEDRQKCIDYWGHKAEKAEAEIERLKVALRNLATIMPLSMQNSNIARQARRALEGKDAGEGQGDR
jgi:hypothetical protein